MALGCAAPPAYRPAKSPRIAYGPGGFIKDGRTYPRGAFGGGVEEVVAGDPRAEAEARAGKPLIVGGFVVSLTGLASEVTGLVLATDPKVSSGVQIAGLGMIAAGAVAAVVGGTIAGNGGTHLTNAINIYNDDVSRTPAPPGPSRGRPPSVASGPTAASRPSPAPALDHSATPADNAGSAGGAPLRVAPTIGAGAAPPCRCVFPRSAYLHDGYYQRVSGGLGYASVWGSGPSGNASVSGLGVSLAFALGGTLSDGFVLGATVGFANASGTFKGAPPGAPGRAYTTAPLLGVLVDWFPLPKEGWHVGGSLGLGGLSMTDSSHRSYGGSAPAGSLFAGYDEWIGPQYSLGIALVTSMCGRLSTTDAYDTDTGYRFMSASLGFQTSLLWH